MTFEEYIKNPLGKKSTVMTNRNVYHLLYSSKWDTVMVRENGLIIYHLYIDNDIYYAHLKIPSEVVPKFYYDVVARFSPTKENKKLGVQKSSLLDYDVQFYSNDPNFVFTFAHAFRRHDMLIKDLDNKMSVAAIKKKPTEKNPSDELGYVKSLYFLYLAMKKLNLFSKVKWEAEAKKYDKKVWLSTVTHADDKIRDRQKKGELIAKERRLKKVDTLPDQPQLKKKIPEQHKDVKETPNQKNFGKFKRTNFNKISVKGIGKFLKKPFK